MKKMLFAYLFIASLIFNVDLLHANESHINYIKASPEITTSDITSVKNIVTQTLNVYGSVPRLNVPLTVKVWSENSNPSFEPLTRMFNTTRTFIIHPKEGEPGESRGNPFAIAVHEFGHYLFDASLRSFSPQWKTFANMVDKQYLTRMAQQEAVSAYESIDVDSSSEAERKKLFERKMKARKTLNDLYDQLTNEAQEIFEQPIFTASTAYNELFADTLTVLVYKDPRVINLVVTPKNKPLDHRRDFANHAYAETWTDKEAHVMLDPVRSYLWENYIQNHLEDSNHEVFLNKLLKVIDKEIAARVELISKGKDFTVREINERMIKALDQVL